jgi:hypothetical protein
MLEMRRPLTQKSYEPFRRSVDLLFRLFDEKHLAPIRLVVSEKNSIPWTIETNPGEPFLRDCYSDPEKHVQFSFREDPRIYDISWYAGPKAMLLSAGPGGVSWSSYRLALQGDDISVVRRVLNRPGATVFELGLEIADRITAEKQYSLWEMGNALSLRMAGPKRILPLRWERGRWSANVGDAPRSFRMQSQNPEKAPLSIKGQEPSMLTIELPPSLQSLHSRPLSPSLCRLWEELPEALGQNVGAEPDRPDKHPALGFLNHLKPLPEEGTIEFRPLQFEWTELPGISPEECLEDPRCLTEETSQDFFRAIDYLFQTAQRGGLPGLGAWVLENEVDQVHVSNRVLDIDMTLQPGWIGFRPAGEREFSFSVDSKGRVRLRYNMDVRDEEMRKLLEQILDRPGASLLEIAFELKRRWILERGISSSDMEGWKADEIMADGDFLLSAPGIAVVGDYGALTIDLDSSPIPLTPTFRLLWKTLAGEPRA